jgi:hypothetical protein
MNAPQFVFLWTSSAMAAHAAGVSAQGRSGQPATPEEFETASICVERNATDGDTEIVMEAVPGDAGLRHFQVRAPTGRRVFVFDSLDRGVMGMREFSLESPEPEGDQILAAYPQGTYYFWGHTHAGDKFFSTPRLSHVMPAATVILSPSADAVVATGDLAIEWSPVTGISQYLLELENESADPEQSLTFNLPPAVTRFVVPSALLAPGSDYQIGIATVSSNCNVVFVETTFRTEEPQ